MIIILRFLLKNLILLIFLFLVSCDNSSKNLRVPALFSDGMVLQRDTTVAIWGQALPESNIYLYPSWDNMITVKSDSNGFWTTLSQTTNDQKTHSLQIKSGKEKIIITDILMGEIWLASGQSNMEMNFDYCCNSTDSAEYVLRNDVFNKIRMFNVKKRYNLNPSFDIQGRWIKAVKDSIKPFSAVSYFFAKKLYNTLDVPIGVIHASWGGSDVESWISESGINSIKGFTKKSISEKELQESKRSERWFSKLEPVKMPSSGFDLMLGTYFNRSDSTINYLDYFLDNWRMVDFKDEEYISIQNDYLEWPDFELPGSMNNLFGTDDFNGVIIIKNEFFIDSINEEYVIDMGEISLGWAGELREYDFYINGEKISSTLGSTNETYQSKLGNNYRKDYSASPFTYHLRQKIPIQSIKRGRNEIAIRLIGSGMINPITINSSTLKIPIENKWKYKISAEVYKQLNNYTYPYLSYYLYDSQQLNSLERPPINSFSFNEPNSLYNGMINPLIPYTIKGVIWYQGENNAFRHEEYENIFSSLILDWRKNWRSNFPFYYVQIAPYFNYYSTNSRLREAQRKVLKIPKTGMAVTLDIGEKYDIHPSNKHDVGYRLARFALKNDYNKDIIVSGPLYKNISINEDIIRVFFNYNDNGLVLDEGENSEFEIAGEDKNFIQANIVNQGEYLEVFSEKVLSPKYVRYAWSDTSTATLFNAVGLPASSFSSENE